MKQENINSSCFTHGSCVREISLQEIFRRDVGISPEGNAEQ